MSNRSGRGNGDGGWIASLVGAGVLILGGFALGLVAGVVSEEPELVVEHLAGRGERIAWLPDAGSELTGSGETNVGVAERLSTPSEEVALRVAPDEAADASDSPGFPDSPEDPESPELAGRLPAVAAAPRIVREEYAEEPKAVAAVQAAPRPRSDSSRRVGFAVQVGAFTDERAADRVYQKLRGKGFDAYIIPASRSGDGRSRVRVGTVESKADAQALASRLKREERLPTWVLSEGGS